MGLFLLSGPVSQHLINPGHNVIGAREGWTKYGADGMEIRPLQRYKALGNAIALPCADYIMAGIYEVLADRAGKEE